MAASSNRRAQLSQNFLHNRKLVTSLVEQSSISGHDVVLEIGPGRGVITDVLANHSQHVLAVEKDADLAARIRSRFLDRDNITVFAADFLDWPLPATPYKVFASIPYRATTAIIAKLTTGTSPPDDMYLVVQQEAAERFAGLRKATMVSTRLKPWFAPSIVHTFRRRDFSPTPSVDSVLLRLEQRQHAAIPWSERSRYCQLVEAVYSAWKPTVETSLHKVAPKAGHSVIRTRLGAALRTRPSAFTTDEWVQLYLVLAELDDDRVWAALERASESLRQQQQHLKKPTRTRARPSRSRRRV